jgi:restriction endonuclease S subunit
LITYASLNKTTCLSKTYLENIEIPIMELEKQYELLKNIEKYDEYIKKLTNQIDELTKFQQSNLYLST